MSFDANTVATGSPTDTEPDKATWDFWPQAPLGDFARLLPVSPDARLGFQAAVQRMLASPQKEPWPYSARFIHWERTQLDGSDSQAILESTPETGLSSDSQSINGQPQATPPPATITGYYRLNMVDPHPPEFVWILGVGRKGRDVEFIVTTPERKSNDGVFGRHAKLKRSFDSGAIIVATDSHPVWVDGHQLARRRERDEDPAMFQRVAGSQATISLGRMTYKLQMQDLRPSVDRAQMEEAQRSLTSLGPGPSFFLTPTPTMSATLMGNYYVFEPFACGSVGTVHFVTHSVTGKPYALKRIRRRHDQDGRAIQSEIDILRTISHVRRWSACFSSTNVQTMLIPTTRRMRVVSLKCLRSALNAPTFGRIASPKSASYLTRLHDVASRSLLILHARTISNFLGRLMQHDQSSFSA